MSIYVIRKGTKTPRYFKSYPLLGNTCEELWTKDINDAYLVSESALPSFIIDEEETLVEVELRTKTVTNVVIV